MELLALVLQLGLAAVLAVAAVGKLRDLEGARRAVADFGVTEALARPLGVALPFVELALAVLLLPGVTARWAAIATALLFAAFIAGIGWNLRLGRHPDCHCFGEFHSEPAGWPTIARNTVFTIAALAVALHGGVGPIAWLEDRTDAAKIAIGVSLAIAAAGAVQAWLLWKLIGQQQALIAHMSAASATSGAPIDDKPGLPATTSGHLAPKFVLPTLAGDRLSLESLLASGKPALLVFADPSCGPCKALVPDIAEWQRRFANELTVAVISRGTQEENVEKFADHGIGTVALQDEWEVYKAYGVNGTPSGVLVDPDGEIRQPFAGGRDNIRDMVTRAVSDHQKEARQSLDPGGDDPTNPARYLRVPTGPEVGTSSSRLPLPDLDGIYVSLEDYRGDDTMVLFWSADCGFCERMLPDLKEWEDEAGDLVERVLVASAGSTADNKAMGLKSRIVLDLGFNLGNEFGATGTPSAIRLDADGKVASPLVVGADAVMDLLYDWSEPPGTEASGDINLDRNGKPVAVASSSDGPMGESSGIDES